MYDYLSSSSYLIVSQTGTLGGSALLPLQEAGNMAGDMANSGAEDYRTTLFD